MKMYKTPEMDITELELQRNIATDLVSSQEGLEDAGNAGDADLGDGEIVFG